MLSLSLLMVYHQRYDAIALLPGVFVAITWLYRRKNNLTAWTALLPAVILGYLLTGSMLGRWHERLVVPHGWLFLVPICGYLTLAAGLGTLVLLWQATFQPQDTSNRV